MSDGWIGKFSAGRPRGDSQPAAAQLLRPCSSARAGKSRPAFQLPVFLIITPTFSSKRNIRTGYESKSGFYPTPPRRFRVFFLRGFLLAGTIFQIAKGLEQEPEGGAKGALCHELRLRQPLSWLKEMGVLIFFTHHLPSAPKDAEKLNAIGGRLLLPGIWRGLSVFCFKRRAAISVLILYPGIFSLPPGVLRLSTSPRRRPAGEKRNQIRRKKRIIDRAKRGFSESTALIKNASKPA